MGYIKRLQYSHISVSVNEHLLFFNNVNKYSYLQETIMYLYNVLYGTNLIVIGGWGGYK